MTQRFPVYDNTCDDAEVIGMAATSEEATQVYVDYRLCLDPDAVVSRPTYVRWRRDIDPDNIRETDFFEPIL